MARECQLAAAFSSRENTQCILVASVKFMCLVIEDPDVTNDTAHAELSLFCFLPKYLDVELSQKQKGWTGMLCCLLRLLCSHTEFLSYEPPAALGQLGKHEASSSCLR